MLLFNTFSISFIISKKIVHVLEYAHCFLKDRITLHIFNKKGNQKQVKTSENSKYREIFLGVLLILIGLLVFAAQSYKDGNVNAQEKKDFKIIILPKETEILAEDLYTMSKENKKDIKVVLYESKDCYITVALNDKINGIYNGHEIIPKMNTNTIYCNDIDKLTEIEKKSSKEIQQDNDAIATKDNLDKSNNARNNEIVCAFIGAIIGALSTYFISEHNRKKDKDSQDTLAASLLYNDLRSIESYLNHSRDSVNMRYSDSWQNMLAKCSFFEDKEVQFIYQIYDNVYDYNYHYDLKEQVGSVTKEEIVQYKLLKEMFCEKKYEDMMQRLHQKVKS